MIATKRNIGLHMVDVRVTFSCAANWIVKALSLYLQELNHAVEDGELGKRKVELILKEKLREYGESLLERTHGLSDEAQEAEADNQAWRVVRRLWPKLCG